MRSRHIAALLLLTLGMGGAWAQGRNQAGRGATQQQQPQQQTGAPAANTGGRGGGRGFAGGGGSGTTDFYNYDAQAASGQAISEGQPAETHQKITVNGQPFAYTTRAGFLPLLNATTGQSEAHLFYTAYAKEGVSDTSARPIVFFLGGAPGVAAAWQEFGGFGPKRTKFAENADAASSGWLENPATVLNQADLVFVNPVGTGFSRPDQPSWGPNFWNAAGDVASLGAFIRGYLAKYGRATSLLFLAGEDYGTGRVAGLAAYLHEHQVPVRGVVLLSMTMSGDALAGDAQYITLLPSLVMASWHHKKLSPELNAMSAEQIAGQARQFAGREYLHALYNGDRMTADQRAKALTNMARLTGLSKAFLTSNNMRVTLERYNGELMRDEQKRLSYSDARVTGFVPRAPGTGRGGNFAAPTTVIDFNNSNLAVPFMTSYDAYLRRELNFSGSGSAIFYLMSGGVEAFTSTGTDDVSLANAFARNPNLRLFVGVNYFDLNAPFYATEYTLAHLSVAPEVRAKNIRVSHYEAGQMAYVDSKALAKLQRDLTSFLDEAAR